MPIPKHNEMYLPFMRFLSDGQPHPIAEIIKHLAQEMGVSEEDRRVMLPSGVTTHEN